MIPGTLGYGWTSTGEQPSVMSDGGQAEGEVVEHATIALSSCAD